jgi:hypothetical protein
MRLIGCLELATEAGTAASVTSKIIDVRIPVKRHVLSGISSWERCMQ